MAAPDRLPIQSDYVPLADLVRELCFGDSTKCFSQGLSKVWQDLLPNDSRAFQRYVLGSYVFGAFIPVLVSPLLFATGVRQRVGFLAVGASAVAAAFCIDKSRDRGHDQQSMIQRAGEQKIALGLFFRIHHHLKTGRLKAYHAPEYAFQKHFREVPIRFWTADFGWTCILGTERPQSGSRAFLFWPLSRSVLISVDDITRGELAAEYWLLKSYRDKQILASLSRARLSSIKELMHSLSLGDSTLDLAFESLQAYSDAVKGGLSTGKAKAAAAGKPTKLDARGSTAEATVRGKNAAFNDRIDEAIEKLAINFFH